MRWSCCAAHAVLMLVLISGCGGHAGPSERAAGASASSSDAVPDLASQLGLRRISVAVDDRTVMGQPVPAELKAQWIARVRSLESEIPTSIRVVNDPAAAEWLVQVAALERTDIVYLAPSDRQGTPIDDDQLRMSPPGDPAMAWLKLELEQLARDANLSQVAEQHAHPEPLPVGPEGEPVPESIPAPSSVNRDAHVAALDQAIAATEQQLREGYEELGRIQENGFSAQSANSGGGGDRERLIATIEQQRQRYEKLRALREQQFAEASASRIGSVFSVFRRGPAEDLKAKIVEEQSGIYQTPNRTQALLGTYGKMVEGNYLLHRLARFEHRGFLQQLDQVRRFTTVQRIGSGAGEDFVSLVGNRQAWQIVDLAAQISAGRHQEVTFEILGVRLDQNDAIKALNADDDALDYFEYLRQQKQTPCLVLENLVLTSYSATLGSNLHAGANAEIELTSDGVRAQLDSQSGSFTRLTSPVIRCYQAYEVKLHGRKVMELVKLGP